MQPSRRLCLYAFLLVVVCATLSPPAHADNLTIATDPPGATVEVDGLLSGTTPAHASLPGGYFHKTHTAFAARLEHPVVARISKQGYATQQVTLTDGPFEWVAITGRRRGNYFLLKSDHFSIKLRELAGKDESATSPAEKAGPMLLPPPVAEKVAAETPKAETGSVTISSDTSGCEIYIDGKFVGQTPSTFPLDPGAHRIEVKTPGKDTWERTLEVLRNSQINLHATFNEQH
ncbi:MAG TPA: PEGA domain-containing protein [Candidatus Acidoferrales bacterium]|nr:PEGA domain-containing protein [Candidatus Acidoferrales bacterium]